MTVEKMRDALEPVGKENGNKVIGIDPASLDYGESLLSELSDQELYLMT